MLHVNPFFLVSTRRDLDFDALFAVPVPFGFEKIICGRRSTSKIKGSICLKRRNRRDGFDSSVRFFHYEGGKEENTHFWQHLA